MFVYFRINVENILSDFLWKFVSMFALCFLNMIINFFSQNFA